VATLSVIAREAGVSSAVVSRVINEDPSLRVSKATRERVLKVIEKLDYSPNIAARALRSSRTGLIGILLNDVTNPVYAEIMHGAQAMAVKNGKALLVFDSAMGEASAARLAEMIGGGALDALIIQAAGEVSDSVLARAAGREIPTVLLQTGLDIDAHLVCLPDEEAARIATQHLVDLGHAGIGCIATARGMQFTDRRVAGWRTALRSAGISPPGTGIVFAGSGIGEGSAAVAPLLARMPDLSAIVCFNILAAIGALRGLKSLGRRVPEDVSIVAIHDLPFAGLLAAPLTTVAMPLREMGAAAVDMVCRAEFEKSETVVGDPPRLIPRQSTAARSAPR